MENVIKILKELKEKHSLYFIENSIYMHNAKPDSPVPNPKYDLEMIIELNCAIGTLINSTMAKSVTTVD